jgi:hypothetical protein
MARPEGCWGRTHETLMREGGRDEGRSAVETLTRPRARAAAAPSCAPSRAVACRAAREGRGEVHRCAARHNP